MSGSTNFAVLLLMVGLAGILIELSHPGISVPGIVGTAAFLFGVLYLLGVELPEVDITPEVVAGAGVVLAVLCVLAIRAGIRVRRTPVVTGEARLVGNAGVVVSPLDPEGQVRVRGETWTAQVGAKASGTVPAGAHVKVVAVHGLTLEVVPVSSEVS